MLSWKRPGIAYNNYHKQNQGKKKKKTSLLTYIDDRKSIHFKGPIYKTLDLQMQPHSLTKPTNVKRIFPNQT